jgi:hypothetical protein
MTAAVIARDVRAACAWYRTNSHRGRMGEAEAAITLASALITLPIDVPRQSRTIHGALADKFQTLSEALTHGRTSAVTVDAARILPLIQTYASSFGVAGCG